MKRCFPIDHPQPFLEVSSKRVTGTEFLWLFYHRPNAKRTQHDTHDICMKKQLILITFDFLITVIMSRHVMFVQIFFTEKTKSGSPSLSTWKER